SSCYNIESRKRFQSANWGSKTVLCLQIETKQCKREQEKAEISKVNDFRLQIPLFTNVTTTGI
ncbi:hypothetical protein, partial [Paramuribaculum intestinale]|uniref:hypothetical protein n=1 Tax=Paramuribaculum intestinale TaxID=2094151 RepID=UPI0025B732D8